MGYNTNYRVIEKSTNKVLFVNSNTACFAEFNHPTFAAEVGGFAPDRKMEIFFREDNIKLSVKDHERYIQLLNDADLSVELEFGVSIKNTSEYPKRLKEEGLKGICRWTLDFDKYKSRSHLKLAQFLVRYIYESSLYKYIEKALKYIDDNEECDIIEAVRITQGYTNNWTYEMGHYMFVPGVKTKPFIGEIRENFINNKEYRNSELSRLQSHLATTGLPVSTLYKLNDETTYKEHLKAFNLL